MMATVTVVVYAPARALAGMLIHQPTGFAAAFPPSVTGPSPEPADTSQTSTGAGDEAAVVIATGYVVVMTGGVQLVEHDSLGTVVALADETLPVSANVPEFGRVWLPLVNVVAAMVICQPAPVPVSSSALNCWSAATASVTLALLPVSVAVQVRELGEVRFSEPAKLTAGVIPESTAPSALLVTISDV